MMAKGHSLALKNTYDLIILDLNLPERWLRGANGLARSDFNASYSFDRSDRTMLVSNLFSLEL